MLAWISVHDHVEGGKLRGLAKEVGCSQKEALGILISLWLWGLNNADRTGRLKSCDKSDVAEELSKGLSDGLNPEDIVISLIEQEWIDEEEDGTLYLHDWDIWQEQWYKFLSTKEYDAKRKREARARKKAEIQEDEEPLEEKKDNIPPESPSESPPDNPPDKTDNPYTKDFEKFWKAYPRKVGKGEAYKKYKARLNDGFSESELLEAAKNYTSQCTKEKTEERYIKHGKTFLSENTPFTDYLSQKNANQKEYDAEQKSNPFAQWKE